MLGSLACSTGTGAALNPTRPRLRTLGSENAKSYRKNFGERDESDETMTKIPILVAGIFVLILCVRLAQRILHGDSRLVTVDDFVKAQQALGSMLIKTVTIKRILSDEDLNFVTRSGSGELQRLFLRERKTLVVHWFRTIRKQVRYLMDIHLRLAATASPTPGSELRLGLQYTFFMCVTTCLMAVFWIFGPFNAHQTLSYLLNFVEALLTTFRERLEAINPAQLHPGESLVH